MNITVSPKAIALDHERLASYLRDAGLIGGDPLELTSLTGGQSNPTFKVRAGPACYVLRKQPSGMLLPGAHAIDREFRVMAALAGTGVPVPRVHRLCSDPSILGTPFYVMDYLEGRVLMNQSLPGMSADKRADIYAEMNRVIAALHGVDYRSVGLQDFGKPGQYVARQVARWSRQCRDSTLTVSVSMQRLMEWLPENLPAADETTLVHGDYRLDNLVFDPSQPRVIGVLDWELSTLGDPISDFAYQCMSWHVPPALWRGICGLDLQKLGIPSEQDYVRSYEQATGREVAGLWDFYLAFNLFRMAAILHGIAQRAADGTAAAADAAETGAKAGPLADLGWACAQRFQASRRR